MNRDALLKQLSILDFIAVDLQLFLDINPTDTEVIKKYNNVIQEADAVRCKYESMYGPLCSFRSASPKENFEWINCPWPWQDDFNFNLDIKECY